MFLSLCFLCYCSSKGNILFGNTCIGKEKTTTILGFQKKTNKKIFCSKFSKKLQKWWKNRFMSNVEFLIKYSIFIQFWRYYPQNFRLYLKFLNKKNFSIFCHFWLKLGNFSNIKFSAEVVNFILLNLNQKWQKIKNFVLFKNFKNNLKFWGY